MENKFLLITNAPIAIQLFLWKSLRKKIIRSNVGSELNADLIKSYLLKELKINEKEHKLKFKGTDEELNALVNWLGTLKIESKD
ncbi:MAG: hypothetical protein OQJ93_01015 [Ignavibacteriaceae bacterium]|jgi:hypothetical protein|nr:hypothetical protein [Ignavibacteriaceae bacterium]MCW8811959.1 hypothetical protein [Chlorobium sp.]MCW9095944.1 hypothetical protein [Ignavibacteriaceae bacterium]